MWFFSKRDKSKSDEIKALKSKLTFLRINTEELDRRRENEVAKLWDHLHYMEQLYLSQCYEIDRLRKIEQQLNNQKKKKE
jgi:hypothetical protein